MLGERAHRAGVDVGGRTHLERHAPVAHVGSEPAKGDRAVGGDRDVVDDAHAVAEPLCVAPLQRLPDGGEPERLPGVQRGVEVLALDELEGVEVPRRRVAGLRAGHVEAAHARIAEGNGQLGDLE